MRPPDESASANHDSRLSGSLRRWRGLRVVASIGSMVSILSLAHAAPAAPVDETETQIRRGIELRRAGQDESALEAFRSAYKIRQSPRAQSQMGLAEQALGRWVDAYRDLKKALESSADPWVAKNAVTLRQSLAAVNTHLGSLQILGSPAGARVVVDENEVARLPLAEPVRVPAGEVVVTVSAPGFIDITRKLMVGTGSFVREVIVLRALPNAVAQTERVDGRSTEPSSQARAQARGEPAEPDSSDSARQATTAGEAEAAIPSEKTNHGLSVAQSWGIGVAALGVAAVGLGTVFALQAISKNSASQSGCQGDICDASGTASRLDAVAAGNRATVAFIAGGVLTLAGVGLFVFGRSPAPASTALRIVPAIESGRLAVVGTLRF